MPGGEVWRLFESVLAARSGSDPDIHPKDVPTTPVHAEPRPGAMPAPPERDAIDLPREPLAALTGRYEGPNGEPAIVFLHDGRLVVRAPRLAEAELFAETPSRFFMVPHNVVMDVRFDEAGEVAGVDVDLGRGSLSLNRVGKINDE